MVHRRHATSVGRRAYLEFRLLSKILVRGMITRMLVVVIDLMVVWHEVPRALPKCAIVVTRSSGVALKWGVRLVNRQLRCMGEELL